MKDAIGWFLVMLVITWLHYRRQQQARAEKMFRELFSEEKTFFFPLEQSVLVRLQPRVTGLLEGAFQKLVRAEQEGLGTEVFNCRIELRGACKVFKTLGFNVSMISEEAAIPTPGTARTVIQEGQEKVNIH